MTITSSTNTDQILNFTPSYSAVNTKRMIESERIYRIHKKKLKTITKIALSQEQKIQ